MLKTVSRHRLVFRLLAGSILAWAIAMPAWGAPHYAAGVDEDGYLPMVKNSAYYEVAKGSSLIEAERYAEASGVLKSAVEKHPASVIAQYNLGYSLLQQAGESASPTEKKALLTQAEWAFMRARDLNPELSVTYYKLGKLALMREDYQAAEDYYATGVANHPENFALWFNLAAAYEKLGSLDKAEYAYIKAININPRFVYAHNNLGLLYEQTEEYEKAELVYLEALNQMPEYNFARLNLGSLLQAQGRLEQAKLLYQEALRYEPQNPWAYLYLGNVYYKMGQYGQALSSYNQAISLNPSYPTTYYLASLVLQKLNRPDEAIAKSQQYINLAPNGTFSQEASELVMTLQQAKRQAASLNHQ